MMEKLSAKEFDENYKIVCEKLENAALKSGRSLKDVTLLAATKTVDIDTINYAINSGITHIGENRVQELLSKIDGLNPVHKHLIGHLQTNKVKDIITKVELIHSVDSFKLAKEIQKQSERMDVHSDILLEVNIGGEESKSGFSPDEIYEEIYKIAELSRVHIRGLMTIPPICEKSEENRKYFSKLHNMFLDIASKKIDNSSMEILSMGMSDDYDVAVSEGANLVRVGTALFGKRNYLV
ncbi:MAG: YggS family pyridoxal phosphate-dependent enzyme [Ruminococcaceae bacterium]|nr:YggS family pyridoxal phosphate-dependent enzyme [Oscillospiraceae bacterium]